MSLPPDSQPSTMPSGSGSPGEAPWAPGGAGHARWIVCEKTGRWATALRQEPKARGTRLWETRSLAECFDMLQRWGASFVVAELTSANCDALLDRLARLPRDHPLCRVAVVADRSLAQYEGLAREAGAVWFVVSPRELGPLAATAQRHLRLAPSEPRKLAERIWASLPWGRAEM